MSGEAEGGLEEEKGERRSEQERVGGQRHMKRQGREQLPRDGQTQEKDRQSQIERGGKT